MSSITTRSKRAALDAMAAHPSKGLRAIAGAPAVISWNMQGQGGPDTKATRLRQFMNIDEVEIICLQECGQLFGWTDADLPGSWRIAMWLRWSVGGVNERCSLAILTRRAAIAKKTFQSTWAAGRPLIGVRTRFFAAYSIHAPRNNVGYIQSAIAAVRLQWLGIPWIVAGDFNRAPAALAGVTLANTGMRTHQGGRELDYAYWDGFAGCEPTQIGSLISDHYAVKFDLEFALRGG